MLRLLGKFWLPDPYGLPWGLVLVAFEGREGFLSVLFEKLHGLVLCEDAALAGGIDKSVFRTVAKLNTGGACACEKVWGCLAAEAQHLVCQIPDFCLGVLAAADGKPVAQGVGVHAYDGLELRCLGLQIAQVLFRQSCLKACIVPLGGEGCQFPACEARLVSVRQGDLGREVGDGFGIDNGEDSLAPQFCAAGFDEIGGNALAHKLGFGHAAVAFNAEEEVIEFQGCAVVAGDNVLDDFLRILGGDNVFEAAFGAHEAGSYVRINLAAACEQQDLSLACVLFLDHIWDLPWRALLCGICIHCQRLHRVFKKHYVYDFRQLKQRPSRIQKNLHLLVKDFCRRADKRFRRNNPEENRFSSKSAGMDAKDCTIPDGLSKAIHGL